MKYDVYIGFKKKQVMYKIWINDVVNTLNPAIFTGILVMFTLAVELCVSKGIRDVYIIY